MLVYPFRKHVRLTTDWKDKITFNKKTIVHSGLDFGTVDLEKSGRQTDLHIFAMAQGEILDVKHWGSAGLWVAVYYPELDVTGVYGHLGKAVKKKGDKVKQGETFAWVGITPEQTQPKHTHIQYEKGKKFGSGLMASTTQNPYNYHKQMKLKSELTPEPIETVASLKAEIALKTNRITELEKLLTDRDVALNYANFENARHREDLAKKESELQGVRSSLSDKVAELGKVGGELADRNKQYKELQSRFELLKVELDNKQKFIDGMYSTADLIKLLIARIFKKG